MNRRSISSSVLARMKRSAILLGARRVRKGKASQISTTNDLDEEEEWDFEYDLMKPDTIVVVDDTNSYQYFGDVIFAAPQEDLLEGNMIQSGLRNVLNEVNGAEFYLELGSRRLRSLVKETYRTGNEVRGLKKAAEVRSLILERLPLFLYEHTHAKTRVSLSWLNNEGNFTVQTFGKMVVVKTLKFGHISAVKNQEASAVAMQEGRGPIKLWLAANDVTDMYE